MKILIIIPAYNEEKNILQVCNNLKEYNYDYIVINDGSTDNTEKVLLDNKLNHIKLVNNLGIGGAVQTGYKYAQKYGYDIAVQFDGDGQHDAKYIKTITDPIVHHKADMVIGSRFVEKTSDFKSTRARRVGIKVISSLIKIITRMKIYDTTSGFRACNKTIINHFAKSYPTEYPEPVSTTYLLKKKYSVIEKPVNMMERKAGKSSIRSWKNFYYMVNVCLSIIVCSGRDE